MFRLMAPEEVPELDDEGLEPDVDVAAEPAPIATTKAVGVVADMARTPLTVKPTPSEEVLELESDAALESVSVETSVGAASSRGATVMLGTEIVATLATFKLSSFEVVLELEPDAALESASVERSVGAASPRDATVMLGTDTVATFVMLGTLESTSVADTICVVKLMTVFVIVVVGATMPSMPEQNGRSPSVRIGVIAAT